MVKSGQALSGLIICKDTTGALSTPSVGPAGVLYVNGVANGASVTITGANPYKWAVTLPTLSPGDSVQIYLTATIVAIATGSVVFEDIADTSFASDIATTLGASGAGLTTLGDTRIANLDVPVSSRTSGSSLTGDTYARLGAPSGSSISADIQSSRAAIGAIPTNPLLANSAILPSSLIATQGDVRTNVSGTNNLLINMALIPTNPLLANSPLLPATVIAAKADITNPDNPDILAIKAVTDQMRFTVANQIDATPIGSTPTEIDTELTSNHGAGAWGVGGPGGTLSMTYTLTDSTTGNPVQGATIELYATPTYASVVESQITDVFGQVIFNYLVAGTYYLKIYKPGYEPTTDTEIVP